MRILLTNDDGIHSPGLTALERIAATLSDDVWVVAPEQDQSGLAQLPWVRLVSCTGPVPSALMVQI